MDKDNLTTALIDGDIVAYAVSSACDGKFYSYKGERYSYKHELPTGYKEKNIEVIYEPEAWEKTEHSLNMFLDNIVNDTDLPIYQIYLSGRENIRDSIATILPYKGNREGLRKPHHLSACREYMKDYHQARSEKGLEADDLLGIYQTDQTVICSLDKDLLQIVGWHYNWNKQEWIKINEDQGSINFWTQVIIGDKSDNILGLYGVGEKSAHVKKLPLLSDKERSEYCFNLYKQRFGNYAEKFFNETKQLLRVPFEE